MDKVYKVLDILDTIVDTVYRVLGILPGHNFGQLLDMLDAFVDTDVTESWTFWTQRLYKIVESLLKLVAYVQNLLQEEEHILLMWIYTIMIWNFRLGILDQLGKI